MFLSTELNDSVLESFKYPFHHFIERVPAGFLISMRKNTAAQLLEFLPLLWSKPNIDNNVVKFTQWPYAPLFLKLILGRNINNIKTCCEIFKVLANFPKEKSLSRQIDHMTIVS